MTATAIPVAEKEDRNITTRNTKWNAHAMAVNGSTTTEAEEVAIVTTIHVRAEKRETPSAVSVQAEARPTEDVAILRQEAPETPTEDIADLRTKVMAEEVLAAANNHQIVMTIP